MSVDASSNPLPHGTSPVEPRSLTSGKYIPQVSNAKKEPENGATWGCFDRRLAAMVASIWQHVPVAKLGGLKIVMSKVVSLWKLGKQKNKQNDNPKPEVKARSWANFIPDGLEDHLDSPHLFTLDSWFLIPKMWTKFSLCFWNHSETRRFHWGCFPCHRVKPGWTDPLRTW